VRSGSPKQGDAGALGLLGIARRAGAVIHGVDAVRRGVKSGEVELVVLAADAAEGQLGKVMGLLRHHPVPRRWVRDRAVLGQAVGTAAVSVVGVTKRSFAEPLERALPAGRREALRPEEEPGFDAGR
jgi:ribosomal protein L7Ae-like RNA K-turn-binding protein